MDTVNITDDLKRTSWKVDDLWYENTDLQKLHLAIKSSRIKLGLND